MEPCLLLLESGIVPQLVAKVLRPVIPACVTKLALLPVAIQKRCVSSWSGLPLSEVQKLRRLNTIDHDDGLLKLFLYAVGLTKATPVIEHDQTKFVESMDCRDAVLKRLISLKDYAEQAIDWHSFGAFKTISPNIIEHKVTGKQITLERDFDDGFKFLHNEDETRVILKKGAEAFFVADAFQEKYGATWFSCEESIRKVTKKRAAKRKRLEESEDEGSDVDQHAGQAELSGEASQGSTGTGQADRGVATAEPLHRAARKAR